VELNVTALPTANDHPLEAEFACTALYTMSLLLSPLFDSSALGLSTIACFLGHLQNRGLLSEETVYSLSKVVPFAPLIMNLYLITKRKKAFSYFILQSTLLLQTLLIEAFSGKRGPFIASTFLSGQFSVDQIRQN
jgi:hypothetical protein